MSLPTMPHATHWVGGWTKISSSSGIGALRNAPLTSSLLIFQRRKAAIFAAAKMLATMAREQPWKQWQDGNCCSGHALVDQVMATKSALDAATWTVLRAYKCHSAEEARR